MKIQVIKSKRRRKTASAKRENGMIVLRVPWFLPREELVRIVSVFRKRYRTRRASNSDLLSRAEKLNKKFFGGKLDKFSITWSARHKNIFGNCNYRTREIRIATRLKDVPTWVLEATIMHELAHLIEPNHSKKFKKLIDVYPRMERAKGFLLGMGMSEKNANF